MYRSRGEVDLEAQIQVVQFQITENDSTNRGRCMQKRTTSIAALRNKVLFPREAYLTFFKFFRSATL